MVSVPVRAEFPLFASAWNETMPVPMPGEPVVTDSHDALLVAAQLQPPCDVTVTLTSAIEARSPVLTAERLKVQAGGMAFRWAVYVVLTAGATKIRGLAAAESSAQPP